MIVLHFWTNTLVIWPGQVLGAVMLVMMYRFFRAAQKDPKNPIDFGSMFVWPAPGETRTGQTSAIIFLSFNAGMAGIWIIIDREFRGVLTSEMFIGFLTIMVFGKGATEAINAWRDRPPVPPAPAQLPAPQQFIGKADAVNPLPPAATSPAAADQPAAAHAATEVGATQRRAKRESKARSRSKTKRGKQWAS